MDATAFDGAALRAALQRVCTALRAAAPELNALDAQLGDGDLGTTLQRCAEQMQPVLAAPAGTGLAPLLRGCAQACARASGSSFGTLLAVALMAASKSVGEVRAIDVPTLARVLADVQTALCHRGGAQPGDKTMVDALAAAQHALAVEPMGRTADERRAAVQAALQGALDRYRSLPNRLGRARMFAERSIGLDDPGMVAVQRMAQAL